MDFVRINRGILQLGEQKLRATPILQKHPNLVSPSCSSQGNGVLSPALLPDAKPTRSEDFSWDNYPLLPVPSRKCFETNVFSICPLFEFQEHPNDNPKKNHCTCNENLTNDNQTETRTEVQMKANEHTTKTKTSRHMHMFSTREHDRC